MELDIGETVEKRNENPVFYAQYAHARIVQAVAKCEATGRDPKISTDADLRLANGVAARRLSITIGEYADAIERASANAEPSEIAEYLKRIATWTHRFYTEERWIDEDDQVRSARFSLATAAARVIAHALDLLGASAPQQMQHTAPEVQGD